MMLTLEQIRTGMADRKVKRVAAETGLHPQTIYTLVNDEASNPTFNTMKALSDYLTRDLQA